MYFKFMNKISTQKHPRLYYLDWLRVLAFSLLVIVNCSEVFAGSGWWIANSETNSTIGYVLRFFHQWRMPLLFIISGVAVAIMLDRRTVMQFIDDRLTRILVPLISGMIVVVPPMIFFIWRGEGNYISVQEFYLNLLELEWFPKGNFHWLHLWYLAFIFIFSIVIIPVMIFLQTSKARVFLNNMVVILSKSSVLLPIILVFHLPYYISRNFLPSSDLTDLIYYFPYFIFGALFFVQPMIRRAIQQNRTVTLTGGIMASALLYCTVWIQDESLNSIFGTAFMEMLQGPLREPVKSINQWFWVLTVAGFAIHYLNFGNKFLSYANRVVYPFYILHQTIIIIITYHLIPVEASIPTKFIIILVGTVLTVLVTYELVLKRFTVTKMMFGIKNDVKIIDRFPRSVHFINRLMPQLNQINSNSVDSR